MLVFFLQVFSATKEFVLTLLFVVVFAQIFYQLVFLSSNRKMQDSSSTAPAAPARNLQRGIVKQVLSGDSIVIRGVPKGGPPPEKQVNLSNIIAPRLARRPANENLPETKDEASA